MARPKRKVLNPLEQPSQVSSAYAGKPQPTPDRESNAPRLSAEEIEQASTLPSELSLAALREAGEDIRTDSLHVADDHGTTQGQPPDSANEEQTAPSSGPSAPEDKLPSKAKKKASVPTFRLIPRELKDAINLTAKKMNVPRDLLVRVFVDAAISDYHCGKLKLAEKVIFIGRHTLYPPKSGIYHRPGKRPEIRGLENAAEILAEQQSTKAIRDLIDSRFGTRLSEDQMKEMKAISQELLIPIGEVARSFFEYGLKLQRQNKLPPITSDMIARFFHEMRNFSS